MDNMDSQTITVEECDMNQQYITATTSIAQASKQLEHVVALKNVSPSQELYDADMSGQQDNISILREQDRFLPIANVARIMKQYLPENGKIAKDAKQCLQECVSEFISFITSEASERCRTEKRKTINGEDIIHAIRTLGFDNYVEPLTVFLCKYREGTKLDMKPEEAYRLTDDGELDTQLDLGLLTAQDQLTYSTQ